MTLDTATIVFTESGESWAAWIGAMDPIDTLTGIFKRLQHLGYIAYSTLFDADNALNNIGLLRQALVSFKADRGSDSDSTSASSGSEASSNDGSGLADDGTLDANTSKLLRAAHGC